MTDAAKPATDAPEAPKLTAAQLEAEILRSRAELAAQIDELTRRVDPRQVAEEYPAKVAVAAAVVVAAVVGLLLLGRRRRRR